MPLSLNFLCCGRLIATLSLCSLLFFPQKLLSAELKTLWTIENTFQLPESAAFDPKRNQIYVSNIVKYAKDGTGFISRIDANGKNLELKWLAGLNSPTGLSVYQDFLYAVDMDVLLVIDLKKGQIIKKIKAPDSGKPPVLNDVAISTQGDVYVSGSASRKIYKLENGSLSIFVSDKKSLLKANGLLVDDLSGNNGHLIHGGQFWSRFSLKNATLLTATSRPSPSSKLYGFDGITHDGKGGYIVTMINDSRLWRITKEGKTHPLSEEKINGIDIHFDKESRRLFVPRVGGGLSVFQVE